MEKVNFRSDRMAWREGVVPHVESLGNLMVVDHAESIEEWRTGIERGRFFTEIDQAT